MPSRRKRTFQALLLALLGMYLLERAWSGQLLLYINQRFAILVVLAGIGLVALAQAAFQARMTAGDGEEAERGHAQAGGWLHSGLAWLALPLLVGVLVPVKALGTSSLANRGIQLAAPFQVQSAAGTLLEKPPGQRSVLDWIRAFDEASDPAGMTGEPVDAIGFVYHDARLADGQFLLARYTIACCIADASAIGITVAWPAAAGLADNQWVRVQGEIAARQQDGQSVPLVRATQVTTIPEPAQPYLFP